MHKALRDYLRCGKCLREVAIASLATEDLREERSHPHLVVVKDRNLLATFGSIN